MEPSFNIEEVSELIARLVSRLSANATGFVTHHDIVTAVQRDAVGAGIVARARAMRPGAWSDDHEAAGNMVAWFSQQITTGVSPWAAFFDRERRGDVWAYRAKTLVTTPIATEPDLVAAIEGDPRLFFHVRRERDPALVRAKRSAARRQDGQLTCEACGFVMPAVYPGLSGDVCEIHHRRPLAVAAAPVETRLEDLAVLCPNCHRAIHQTAP